MMRICFMVIRVAYRMYVGMLGYSWQANLACHEEYRLKRVSLSPSIFHNCPFSGSPRKIPPPSRKVHPSPIEQLTGQTKTINYLPGMNRMRRKKLQKETATRTVHLNPHLNMIFWRVRLAKVQKKKPLASHVEYKSKRTHLYPQNSTFGLKWERKRGCSLVR